jgi:hypothetical protein
MSHTEPVPATSDIRMETYTGKNYSSAVKYFYSVDTIGHLNFKKIGIKEKNVLHNHFSAALVLVCFY